MPHCLVRSAAGMGRIRKRSDSIAWSGTFLAVISLDPAGNTRRFPGIM